MRSGNFAIRLVHLSVGWRYWAFRLYDCEDEQYGLDPNGYATQAEALQAVNSAQQQEKGETDPGPGQTTAPATSSVQKGDPMLTRQDLEKLGHTTRGTYRGPLDFKL